MTRIDRFFLWTERLSDTTLARSFAGLVVAIWLGFGAFGLAAWWALS